MNEIGLGAVFCDWNLAYEDFLELAKSCALNNMRLQVIIVVLLMVVAVVVVAIFEYKVKHRLMPRSIRFIQRQSTSVQPQELGFPYFQFRFCPLWKIFRTMLWTIPKSTCVQNLDIVTDKCQH